MPTIQVTPDQTGRPRILYVVHRVPYPPDKGDRIRTFQILRYLARRAEVHVACLADEPVAEHDLATLRSYCPNLAVISVSRAWRGAKALASLALGRTATQGAFSSAELRAVLREWARTTRFDFALASSSSMAPYLRLPELAHVPAVVDLIDVDSQKWLEYAHTSSIPKSWLYRIEGRRLRAFERQLAHWASAITLVSSAEVSIFRQFCRDGRVEAVSNGVDLEYFRPAPGGSEQGCVFVGALDYWPNVEGICWFCREVWPELRRRHPDATLTLVGRRPSRAVCRLTELAGVTLAGQVPDVRPYVARAAVCVAPLRIARGVQNKVLESLAMAKATVVSPEALEGIEAEPGTHLLSAGSPRQWIEHVSQLLGNPAARERLGAAGRRFTEENHRWERCLQPLDRLLGLTAERSRSIAASFPIVLGPATNPGAAIL
ncbi:MAG: TIGR03087 family PEP-CTERM/XrtA system glycosyltransferase [Gemmataceae bacterium]|nr:TIGR03087 family PEP-CTERM/XrtA system glycosyltransferase [Gemmataceae bacterium]